MPGRTPAMLAQASENAGIDAKHVMLWRVDPKTATPERARLSLNGRKRTAGTTTDYIWGPDLRFLTEGR